MDIVVIIVSMIVGYSFLHTLVRMLRDRRNQVRNLFKRKDLVKALEGIKNFGALAPPAETGLTPITRGLRCRLCGGEMVRVGESDESVIMGCTTPGCRNNPHGNYLSVVSRGVARVKAKETMYPGDPVAPSPGGFVRTYNGQAAVGRVLQGAKAGEAAIVRIEPSPYEGQDYSNVLDVNPYKAAYEEMRQEWTPSFFFGKTTGYSLNTSDHGFAEGGFIEPLKATYDHVQPPEPSCPWCHEVPASTPHICQAKPKVEAKKKQKKKRYTTRDAVDEIDRMFKEWDKKEKDKSDKLRKLG